ncbi:MAG: RIO1 family regulatory kinase/ATPase [Thermoplasmata archaeon]
MPNDGYLDSSVHWKVRSGSASFRELRYSEAAELILDGGLATDVRHRIGSGKEADVYACEDGPMLVAVKVYRFYRTSHRGGRPVKQESMGHRAAHELEMLTSAWRGGARVPEPGRRVENMFSMEYLGSSEGPAPRMSSGTSGSPERLRDAVLDQVRRLAAAGVVHTDLSPFNILLHRGKPWVIDLGQAVRVDRLGASPWIRLTEAGVALSRGLRTFDRYFRRYGLRVAVEEETEAILATLDRFGVLH